MICFPHADAFPGVVSCDTIATEDFDGMVDTADGEHWNFWMRDCNVDSFTVAMEDVEELGSFGVPDEEVAVVLYIVRDFFLGRKR